MVKRFDYFIIAILLSFGAFFVYLYFYIDSTQTEIKNRIIKNKVKDITNVLHHIEENILKVKGSKELDVVLKNRSIRENLEIQLTQMLSKNTKYVYFLFLDKYQKFRFLLDGSKTDKARFYQKFDPIQKDIYYRSYKNASVETIIQKDVENLSITILYPVKQDGKAVGILSVDMTTDFQNDISRLIEPLKNFFIVLIIFIFLLISVSMIQLFKYFKTKKQLYQDQLTEIFNRHYLQEISSNIKLTNYAVAMLDLDRFKIINDTYGHKTGDIVLQECVKIFKNNISKEDILIRYGGEEFLLFIAQKENSYVVCKKILDQTSQHTINYDDNEINMTLSIGLIEDVSFEKNLSEIIKKADSMLYLAKQRGRDQIVCYKEDIKNIAITNKKGVDDVKDALNQDRIICHFQPIVEPKIKNILKYEALVRIVSKDGNILFLKSFLLIYNVYSYALCKVKNYLDRLYYHLLTLF